jgi:hypothetical protein
MPIARLYCEPQRMEALPDAQFIFTVARGPREPMDAICAWLKNILNSGVLLFIAPDKAVAIYDKIGSRRFSEIGAVQNSLVQKSE